MSVSTNCFVSDKTKVLIDALYIIFSLTLECDGGGAWEGTGAWEEQGHGMGRSREGT